MVAVASCGGAKPKQPAPGPTGSSTVAPGVLTSGPAVPGVTSAQGGVPAANGPTPPDGAQAGTTGAPGAVSGAGGGSAAAPLGQGLPVQTENGPAVSAKVFAFQQPVRSSGEADPGTVFAALDAELCVNRSPSGRAVSLTNEGWRLEFADGTRAQPVETTYADFPKPAYPFQQTVAVGRCLRGWIVFSVPDKARPDVAVYGPDVQTGRWKL
jgi:hypothetical protein